jgi:hypothetical protein
MIMLRDQYLVLAGSIWLRKKGHFFQMILAGDLPEIVAGAENALPRYEQPARQCGQIHRERGCYLSGYWRRIEYRFLQNEMPGGGYGYWHFRRISGRNLTVCFITTQLEWGENTDVVLSPTPFNGLRTQSLLRTSKIATLDKTLAKGLLGRITAAEFRS